MTAQPISLVAERIGPGEIRLPVSTQHQQNLLDCVRTRKQTVCPIDVAVRSDTICLISHIAVRLGRKLKWDPEKEKADAAEVNALLAPRMRPPWHL